MRRLVCVFYDGQSRDLLIKFYNNIFKGPATACALAKANNWNSLVAPSLIVGNLGYAIATFAGIAFHTYFSKVIP